MFDHPGGCNGVCPIFGGNEVGCVGADEFATSLFRVSDFTTVVPPRRAGRALPNACMPCF